MVLGGFRSFLVLVLTNYAPPSNEMEKTATSDDDDNSNHFQDATLLCSLIFQKQESREMSHTNLTGLIRKNLKGGTLSLFSL